MDDGDIPVLRQLIGRRELMSLDQRIDGTVAVGMESHRDAEVIDGLQPLVDDLLRGGQLAPPVLLAAGAAGEIGRGEESGPALGRAVDGDLHAPDLEALVVLAPGRNGRLFQDLFQIGNERECHHVDDVGAGLGGALHGLERRDVRGPFVGRRHAGLGVQHLAGPAPLDLLRRRHRLRLAEHGQEGGFHDQPVGLVGARLAHDHAARWRRGGGADAVVLLGTAVQHTPVHGHMVDAHRIIRKSLVEVVAVQMTPARHDGFVVAVGHDHLTRGNLPFRREGLQRGDDAVDVLARAGRRRIKLRLVGHQQRVDVVGLPTVRRTSPGYHLDFPRYVGHLQATI